MNFRILMTGSILFIFASCSKKSDKEVLPEEVLFTFHDTLKDWIIDLPPTNTWIFESAAGTRKTYTINVLFNDTVEIKSYGPWNGVIKTEYFALDMQGPTDHDWISFRLLLAHKIWGETILMDKLYLDKKPERSDYHVKLGVYMYDFATSDARLLLPPPSTSVTFLSQIIGIREYHHLIKVVSPNNAPLPPYMNMPGRNLKEVWYDKKFGIVYFKDFDGLSWIRIN